jgi:response regulator of citrate/malate metabolism
MNTDQQAAQQAAREATMAVVLSHLKPVQFNRFQAMLMAWQVYKAAKAPPVGTLGGGGGPREPL